MLATAIGIAALGGSVVTGVNIGRTNCPTVTATPVALQNKAALVFPDVVPLPDNVMNSTYAIPNTSLSIAYPKNGFYGFGVNVLPENVDPERSELGGVGIIPNTNPDIDRPVELSVGVYELKNGDTLRGIIESGHLSTIDIGQENVSGSYLEVNNHEFFVYKRLDNDRLSSWHAISVGKNEVVSLTFQFSLGNDAFSYSAFRNDDQLFLQVISHIKFD